MNNTNNIPPAQLWIGPHAQLLEKLEQYAQKIFCTSGGCRHCITCRQIQQKQHHALCWLYPEKNYTLDEIAMIPATIAYALNDGELFFFIIQKADFLTATCSNSLLKSLEEPPTGYHFILLAERAEAILPTIRSRCTTQTFHHEQYATSSALFDFFTTTTLFNPTIFLTALEQSKITERESIELLDSLLNHWMNIFKEAVRTNNLKDMKESDRAVQVLKQAFLQPPMPGSSKLFWKNLYLQLKQ